MLVVGTGAVHGLSEAEVRLLRVATRPARAEEHARRASVGLERVQGLLERGLLLSEEGLRQAISDRARSREPARIEAIAVLSCRRPATLARTLRGFSEATSRPVTFTVLDDTPPAEQEPVRQAVQRVGEARGLELEVVHKRDRARLAESLGRQTGFLEEARFALLGLDEVPWHAGANRTALLLCHAGQVVLSLDDDVMAAHAPCPDPLEGVEVATVPDPTSFWFYPGREAAWEAGLERVDPLQLHEAWLGVDVGTQVAGGAVLDELRPRLARVLSTTGARVGVSTTGMLGDTGMGLSHYLLRLSGHSRERLVASREAYESALTARTVLRCARRPVLTDSAHLMAPCLGLDLRHLVPPFTPVQRNADGVWGVTLGRCAEEVLVAHLPWAVQHDPPEARTWAREDAWKSAGSWSFSVLLSAWIREVRHHPGTSTATRLEATGHHLQALGHLPPAGLREAVAVERLRWAGASVRRLQQLLDAHPEGPRYWRRDVRRALGVARQAQLAPPLLGLLDGRPEPQALELMGLMLRRFGGLLRAWPTLWEAARSLRE